MPTPSISLKPHEELLVDAFALDSAGAGAGAGVGAGFGVGGGGVSWANTATETNTAAENAVRNLRIEPPKKMMN